ncbi:type IV secretion system protein VirB10 [Cetobacterium ceti]|uniref:Type IV secretion system protein VirB10 n=1 Tax=Cetobacterium ceti TaxID=180163 RepID=A0A1T4QR28_9FUSO|nr:TrbI/VirB10 family protein [Cetobacterium ceti]SKA06126.1 type IV secretion system protein VirB10 [Cetobacterium ceti]
MDIENYDPTSENKDNNTSVKEENENIEYHPENKIGKKKIIIVGGILSLILVITIIFSSIISEKIKAISKQKEEKQEKVQSQNNSTRKKITASTGYQGKKIEYLTQQEKTSKTKVEKPVINANKNNSEPVKQIDERMNETLQAYYEQVLQEELAARKSTIKFDDSEEETNNKSFFPPTTQQGGGIANLQNPIPNMLEQDQNKIKEKKEFLRGVNEGSLDIYNPFKTVSPLSEYQVDAGSIIPGVFITGVKSTLPGRMIGQVRENVYDSTTGNYLLIPKGARLLGMYDANVTFGQNRIMIIWERIIFPNGKSIQLDRFSGTDLSGYAGVTGKVNNHYGKLLTSVVLSSILGAGTAIVDDNDNDDKNWKNEAGRGAGEQIINIGSKFAEKIMNISPEITISTGQKFNIIVNSDLLLEPLEE